MQVYLRACAVCVRVYRLSWFVFGAAQTSSELTAATERSGSVDDETRTDTVCVG